MSVKYRSDSSFLLKPFRFCYFLLNLINPVSTAVVWFCSFTFIFSLFFSKKSLKSSFCLRKFWKMLIRTYRTIMGACEKRSLLNKRSLNICWGFSKQNFWKISVKNFTVTYVKGNFFQGDQFLLKGASGRLLSRYFATVILENI